TSVSDEGTASGRAYSSDNEPLRVYHSESAVQPTLLTSKFVSRSRVFRFSRVVQFIDAAPRGMVHQNSNFFSFLLETQKVPMLAQFLVLLDRTGDGCQSKMIVVVSGEASFPSQRRHPHGENPMKDADKHIASGPAPTNPEPSQAIQSQGNQLPVPGPIG